MLLMVEHHGTIASPLKGGRQLVLATLLNNIFSQSERLSIVSLELLPLSDQ
jgi:hypothetical protein